MDALIITGCPLILIKNNCLVISGEGEKHGIIHRFLAQENL